jgi:xylulose-5-phosphate/fructose-6-phosphate phosphoketolase
MLYKAKTLKGYKLDGLDGEIGKVREFYFDDRHWAIRYLVAETGNWLTGRQVLISPHALVAVIEEEQHIAIALTKKQIEDSPSLNSDKPVSRQFEETYYGYYGYPAYWGGPYMWGAHPYPVIARVGEYSTEESTRREEERDLHLRSSHEVSGYNIQAADGPIGRVDDFIIDDTTWAIRYLIIDTRVWWPGKKVLISTQWIESVSWGESKVFVNLSRETIKHSPEYTDESLLTRDYENGLHGHYNRKGYWVDEPAAKRKVSEGGVVMKVNNKVKGNIAVETAKMKKTEKPLSPDLLRKMDAYWRAANYLSAGQIYLYDNPLLKRPLTLADVKHMLLGHWGTTPGQNFIYVHLNRVIKKYDLDMIYVSGPGHGGPAVVGNTYLEGSYSEIYPNISQDEAGMRKLFIQFSFPGGIPSHVSPECPGSIHEGGELGYSLSHSFGAVFDNPDLVVACVVGDGEAETGPLATAWHSNKFLDPATDGAVLPILHLNGYKIANPTILARITREELEQLLRGYGWTPYFVEGHEPTLMHEAMAETLDTAVEQIKKIQRDARAGGKFERPRWPMIVLNSPKGWTGPKMVDGLQIEGTFRAHQVPLSDPAAHPEHLKLLEDWLRSYRPEELFDEQGRLIPELAELAPEGERRMGANPHANGGMLLRDLRMPDFRDYAVDVPSPGVQGIGDTHVLGPFLRDVAKLNSEQRNFRVFGPDETLSNGLEALFGVTKRQWDAATEANDEFLAPTGRVMEMLSEHQCEGWLEGYLLTGRHGLFNCYEAFIHIVDSMFNQHAKWLKVTSNLPWRRKIASLNYLLASHVWRQDHNGFTHQDPGFVDHVVNKKAEIVRVYLPPDANCLLSVMDHCLRSRHYVNVVIAGKHPAPQWLSMDAAVKHCTRGIGIWPWAGNDQGAAPDVVMACCGDVPTLETLAAVSIMREHLPELKIRVVNVVDLMKLEPQTEHPHGLSDIAFDEIFTRDKPVIFAFHAYPWLIHRLTYRRANHHNIHVRGYKEEGTITTPFDMTVLNDLDRFHLVMDAIDRLPQTGDKGVYLKQQLEDKLIEHKQYIAKYGQDLPEIRNWKWSDLK